MSLIKSATIQAVSAITVNHIRNSKRSELIVMTSKQYRKLKRYAKFWKPFNKR